MFCIDLKLKILTEDSGIKAVSDFIALIGSCFKAIEEKYLQQLSIGVCLNPEKRNEVLEAYTVQFQYSDDRCSVTCDNNKIAISPKMNDPTVTATLAMLENICAITDILAELPKNSYLTIKLLYYDDVTPRDYEPTGFEPSPDLKFDFNGKSMNIQLGKVKTSANAFNFRMRSTLVKSLLQGNLEDPMASFSGSQVESVNSYEYIRECQSSQESNLEDELKVVNCPCKGSNNAKRSEAIACSSCNVYQHKICYGIIDPEYDPDVFYCAKCMIQNSNGNTLLDLAYQYQGKNLQDFCMSRRALLLCRFLKKFSKEALVDALGCSKPVVNALVKKFLGSRFLKQSGKDKYQVWDSNIALYGMKEYFPRTENKENENEPERLESDLEMETAMPLLEKEGEIPDVSHLVISPTAMLRESSINQVENQNLNDPSPIRRSKKRKVSDNKNVIRHDDSGGLFQTVKRVRRQLSK